jgi:MFS family permease
MSSVVKPAAKAFASPWWIAFGSCLGLVVANGSICVFAFSVFIKPLEAQFGWDRASISVGLTFCALFAALLLPVVGRLMDRFGVRPVMLVSIVLFGINVACVALSNALPAFIALVALTGITGAGQGPMGYIKSISAHFDRNRGIAIGIAVSGTGIGVALLPQYAQWLITNHGWRVAFVGLAIVLVVIAVPSVFLFVREPRAAAASRVPNIGAGLDMATRGHNVREAVRSRIFWVLVFTGLLVATVLNGVLVHVASLLSDRGWTPQAAAGVLAWAGLASMAGRVVGGYLLDRWFAPYVAMLSFASALVGIALLASGQSVVLGVLLIGITTGTEIDIIGFMTSRYFGLRQFGQLYGYLFGVFLVGTGLGPVAMGAIYTRLHSYDAGFVAFAVMLGVAFVLMFFLGAYNYPVHDDEMLVAQSDARLPSDA